MGRFSNLVSKAGEIVQQANQEYQKAKQQQQQQQSQRQYGQQGQSYGQHQQYGARPNQQQQYGQPQQYNSQTYNPQQPTTPPSATPSWQQYQPQYQQQPLYQQYPTQPPPAPQYDTTQIHLAAEHALAQAKAEHQQATQQAGQQLTQLREQHAAEQAAAEKQLEADRQYAERLAAQFREEEERELRRAEEEMRRLKTEVAEQQTRANQIIRQQEHEILQQIEQLQLRSEAPPPSIPPRSQDNADFRPPMPPRQQTDQVSGVMGPDSEYSPALVAQAGEMPPPVPIASRPGVVQGAGRPYEDVALEQSNPGTQSPMTPVLGAYQQQQQESYPASMNPFKQDQISIPTDGTSQPYPRHSYLPPPVQPAVTQPASQSYYSYPNDAPSHLQSQVTPSTQQAEAQSQITYSPPPPQQVGPQSPSTAYSSPPGPPPQPQNSQGYVVHPAQTTGSQPLQKEQFASTNPFAEHSVQQSYTPPQIQPAQTNAPQQNPVSVPTWSLDTNNNTTYQPPQPPRYVRTPPPPQPHPCGVKAMAECTDDPITYDMDWFYHPDATSFLICPRCYVDHIWNSQFRNAFKREWFTDKKPRKCLFGCRRVKEQLWPNAVSSGSLNPALEFFKYAPTLGDCPQATIKENESWYTSVDIPGMTMCKTCFENDLAGTSFAKHFALEKTAQAFCDSSVWCIKRLYDDHVKTGNWAAFVEVVKVRIQLPSCPTQAAIKANDRAWYKSKRGPEGLQVCAACYYDYFYASPDQETFQQVAGGNYNTSCVMGHVNLIIPLHHAIVKKDRSIFWKALDRIDPQPFCDSSGIKGATWYTLPSDPPGFGICGGCYAGIVQTIGGTKFFVPKRGISKNDTLVCCLNLGHARAIKYLTHYSESVLKGDPEPLNSFALRFGNVPPCQRRHLRGTGGRRAWGWGVAAICEECYLTFAQGTNLESRFFLNGERDAPDHERMCDMYSPRMRDLYTKACQSGDLQGFLAYGEHRHQVWCETIPVCENIVNQAKIAAMQAQTLGISGSFYKAMGGAVDATQGHSYTVGNAYAGYGHANEWVLQGHVYDRQSRETAASAVNGGNMMQVSMLEQRWAAVE